MFCIAFIASQKKIKHIKSVCLCWICVFVYVAFEKEFHEFVLHIRIWLFCWQCIDSFWFGYIICHWTFWSRPHSFQFFSLNFLRLCCKCHQKRQNSGIRTSQKNAFLNVSQKQGKLKLIKQNWQNGLERRLDIRHKNTVWYFVFLSNAFSFKMSNTQIWRNYKITIESMVEIISSRF